MEKTEDHFEVDDIPQRSWGRTDPLVVTIPARRMKKDKDAKASEEWAIEGTLIDIGSSADILFYRTFKDMGYNDVDLKPSAYIHGFNKAITKPKGEVIINMPLGEIEMQVTLCVVDVESPYNMLLGKPWLHGIKGVASTLHRCIRFPMPSGIGEIAGDTERAKSCNQVDVKNYEGRAKKRKI
ncbi:uncharacterized protein LOC113359693 [Papaver somniferum]|uniref:uncharacterized protein LOC113359693 n=1 Tax=Papaver somniferum TaxID=3469 RepID=UPI000E6FD1DD|nr:uncharacterized protein LOC113359693 [Papaver somniferum]